MKEMFKARLLRSLGGVLALLSLLTATGCLYPQEQTPGAGVSSMRDAKAVQEAVDLYYEQEGVLPIQNASESTPVYEKFKADLAKLKRTGYLAQIPPTAFENGGSYQFLIIDELTKPAVKLLDLTMFQAVGDVQKKLDAYRDNHDGAMPSGDLMYPGYNGIDFDALGMRDPQVRSMFTGQTLSLMLDEQGIVFVDYGADIARAMKGGDNVNPPEGDLRRVLIDDSVYVPVRSPVYRLEGGDPAAVPAK